MAKTNESTGAEATGGSRRKHPEKVSRKLVGVRLEPRLVKVMKAVSELHDCAVGELLEQVFWASMEGGNFFAEKGRISPETRKQLDNLKSVYGVDYDADYLRNVASDGQDEA